MHRYITRCPEPCSFSSCQSSTHAQLLSLRHGGHTVQSPARPLSSRPGRRRSLPSDFPVLHLPLQPVFRHVCEANLRNSAACQNKYEELMKKVRKGGGDNAIARHTQRNKKLLVMDRLRLLLDDDDFLELSPFAGLGLPYGDIPSAGCLTGIGRINGLWCVFIANDATVKGGTAYPITVKKQLRAQEVAIQNRLPCVYLVDSGGAFLPLQSEIFPDKNQGGRTFYNEAIMSAMKIPQVAVVCGSCTAGGAYIPTMAEETVMVQHIGTIFLGGPPLVKAATGEEVTPEDLGGAKLHSEISGCVDHFAVHEKEAYACTRNIISTLNYELPWEVSRALQFLLLPILYACAAPVTQSPARPLSSRPGRRRSLPSDFPVLHLPLQPVFRHVCEANLRNSAACQNKYEELMKKVRKGGGDNAIARHTQRNKKLLVKDRLRLLLDDDDFLELSPFAGLDLPYGDIPSAGCLTGIGRINGLWCVISGCVDHFAVHEKEAYACTRNIISTLNYELPWEVEEHGAEEPLHSCQELLQLAPLNYNHMGIVANNGELSSEASLKGSHFVQLCDQRDIPLLFLQNTVPRPRPTLDVAQAAVNSNCLKAQSSMMSAVACASVPKITVVIGGCHGVDSYAMCGRSFDPNFLFLWPNARVSMIAPGHGGSLLPSGGEEDQEEEQRVNRKLKEESSAFFSSGRLWDDGIILPQDTRKVLADCLDIISQQQYQLSTEKQQSPLLRI
ncbi:hypothetical protein CRUP_012627 [Coryphaenoides rupestris]|nr:hypothetical protein CRUP_012627 [Coryphaenoides rupestris]